MQRAIKVICVAAGVLLLLLIGGIATDQILDSHATPPKTFGGITRL